jgi:hypothetical protein
MATKWSSGFEAMLRLLHFSFFYRSVKKQQLEESVEGLALQNVHHAPFTDGANIFRLLLKNLVITFLET